MSSPAHVDIKTLVEGDQAVVRLDGELDLDGVGALTEVLASLAAQRVTTVSVDAGLVTFIDSSGLRALLQGRERLVNAGIAFQVSPASAAVTRVLDMTGTRDLLTGA
ncbi:MAG: STAS domain-containing protein [Acidimicrobiia bacterium]